MEIDYGLKFKCFFSVSAFSGRHHLEVDDIADITDRDLFYSRSFPCLPGSKSLISQRSLEQALNHRNTLFFGGEHISKI